MFGVDLFYVVYLLRTLGLDSVTVSSSISLSLPRDTHGWGTGVVGITMSSSSSSCSAFSAFSLSGSES